MHCFILGGLLFLGFLPVLNRIGATSPLLTIGAACILGLGVSVAVARVRLLRDFLVLLSVTGIIFPLLFLFFTPVSKILFPQRNYELAEIDVRDAPPIILVVFDEFSTVALLDERQKIDSARYPNFATLAQNGFWFRRATTVHNATTYAVPAILTGTSPSAPRLPTLEDYPRNLFTLLGGAYRMNVHGQSTKLCPEDLTEGGFKKENFPVRIGLLFSDLFIVMGYLVDSSSHNMLWLGA